MRVKAETAPVTQVAVEARTTVVAQEADISQAEDQALSGADATPKEKEKKAGIRVARRKSSGAVMILMSTTQAVIFMIAALMTAAMFGAFLLWLFLVFDPFGELNLKLRVVLPP